MQLRSRPPCCSVVLHDLHWDFLLLFVNSKLWILMQHTWYIFVHTEDILLLQGLPPAGLDLISCNVLKYDIYNAQHLWITRSSLIKCRRLPSMHFLSIDTIRLEYKADRLPLPTFLEVFFVLIKHPYFMIFISLKIFRSKNLIFNIYITV